MGVWENRDLFFLRDALITLFTQWKDIFGDDTPCPITFTIPELELRTKEEENMDGIGSILSLSQDQGLLLADGMVKPEDYQTAIENCHKYKEVFLGVAQEEGERDLYSKLWPYQEDPKYMFWIFSCSSEWRGESFCSLQHQLVSVPVLNYYTL